jgi:hypothetical protein
MSSDMALMLGLLIFFAVVGGLVLWHLHAQDQAAHIRNRARQRVIRGQMAAYRATQRIEAAERATRRAMQREGVNRWP